MAVQPSPEPALDECSTENLTVVNPGQLTVGAAAPLEEPYFVDGQPDNQEGFESALVYAIAEGLGFRTTQVEWRVTEAGTPLDPSDPRVDFLVGRIPADEPGAAWVSSVPYLQLLGAEPDLIDGDGQAVDPERPRTSTSYALAFAPGDPLVTCVDGVLGELIADGELTELADTWLPPSGASSDVARIPAS